MFLGGPPINHVVKACLQIAFGATLIVGARRLAKLFYPDLFEAAAHK